MIVKEQRTCTSGHYRLGFVSIVAIVVLFLSCNRTTYAPVRNHDFSSYYTTEKTRAMPSYAVYNLNDSVSRLYFTVKSTDLLYSRSNTNNKLTAHFIVQYVLHTIDQPKVVADSGRIIFSDINESGALRQIAGYADFDVPRDGNYFLEVTMRDLNKMTVTYELIMLDHVGKDAFHNFLLTQRESETPLFRTYVGKDESFSIRHNNPLTTRLYVSYYKNTAGPARPPYALPVIVPEVIADSTWTIDLCASCPVKFPLEGIYRLATTAESRDGMIITRFADGFPKITTPVALLEPLRYITTKKEYTTLETSANVKAAVDSFWISTGGSRERARELISAYYGRIEIANIHFSSAVEGWKTDRGMIYTIYGEPQNVYRSARSETWVYGLDQGGNTLNFVFNRNPDATSPNEYVLERNQSYNIGWITAVDYWKQGQVYRAR